MTAFPSRLPSPALDPRKLVLATDLDGTLLAGPQEARRRLRDRNAMTSTLCRAITMWPNGAACRTERLAAIEAEAQPLAA